MIDAEFRSEERFSRLALAYKGDEEKNLVSDCVDTIIAKHKMQPEIHTTAISNGKEVLVIEYHDDNNRESGEIFEEIIKALNIKECN
ncbi:MAG: hypothetical protein K8R44_02290 [Sulfurimonas sp.]|jgi:endo-alpha-1,4-polygalactosaminidase (GH114 family)|nr:hypothetical protein [Sulfurimonas sp.]